MLSCRKHKTPSRRPFPHRPALRRQSHMKPMKFHIHIWFHHAALKRYSQKKKKASPSSPEILQERGDYAPVRGMLQLFMRHQGSSFFCITARVVRSGVWPLSPKLLSLMLGRIGLRKLALSDHANSALLGFRGLRFEPKLQIELLFREAFLRKLHIDKIT